MDFDGNDSIELQNLILNSVLTVEFWIRPESPGQLLAIGDFANAYLGTVLPSFLIDGVIYEATTQWTTNWANLAYVIENKSLKIYLNGNEILDTNMTSPIIDSPENGHIVGTGYIGYIYSIHIKNRIVSDWDIDPDHSCNALWDCETCPKDVCLSECAENEFIEVDRSCSACSDSCNAGCMRSTNCRLCLDPYCTTCDEYGRCLQCISGADGDPCQCINNYQYNSETDKCGECSLHCSKCLYGACSKCDDGYYFEGTECQACSAECAQCDDGTNTSCTVCQVGYWQLPHSGICSPDCPSSTIKEQGKCVETTD